MSANLTCDQVWREVKKQQFAVLGTVSRKGQPLTTGIVYTVKGKHLYITTGRSLQKARNIQNNPGVSLTVTIEKRIPFLPWVKIPAATITFQGEATLHGPDEIEPHIQKSLVGKLKLREEEKADQCFVRVKPERNFVTYGVGVSLRTMLEPARAMARIPV